MTGPLSSLKVLDFTSTLPGPFATMVLADLGADVVRVESPRREDLVRELPPFDGGTSVLQGWLGRSKRSIAIDLKQPEGIELVQRLIRTHDIVVEGFRPGVMERLGLDHAALSAVNPGLIQVSISGYGDSGPLRERAGHDINFLALAGVLSHSGSATHGPARLGVQVADVGGGAMGALVGLLAAVVHRNATGAGQAVEIGMYDMAVAWNATAFGNYFNAGHVAGYEQELLNGGSFYGCYETGDGRYLSLGGLEPQFWQRLCDVLELPELLPRHVEALHGSREINARIAARVKQHTFETWLGRFGGEDACVEPVLRVDEAAASPQFAARGLAVDVPRGDGTAQRQIASPWRFSASAPRYTHAGAERGAHTDEILGELGVDAARRAELHRRGIIGVHSE